MPNDLVLRVFDVEHGACTMLLAPNNGRLAMIDSGHNSTTGWRPSSFVRGQLGRSRLDYLFVTNADQDHLSGLNGLWEDGITVATLYRNWSPAEPVLRGIKQAQGELTDDIERYLRIHAEYVHPVTLPFDQGMGGVTCTTFCNTYPEFADTNNLSLVVFIKYGDSKCCFQGTWRTLDGRSCWRIRSSCRSWRTRTYS
jgi:beta-lactamase superfamily II metal-dependent hydrolase